MSKKQKTVHSERSRRVFVAMSGGVDSSVAAYLLKKQDYNLVGVFMRSYNIDGCAERDAEDARRVAEKLEIPFYTWDFEEEYKKRVVDYMVEGYRNGLTPNPDIMCNKEIKFGLFLDKALKMGADFVATGHYVRLQVVSSKLKVVSSKKSKNYLPPTTYHLLSARDQNKDQSYFLWTLTQKQLKHCLFPIGDYLKPDIRKIAKKAGLPTAEKKDSQGICFLGKVTLADFLRQYIPEKPGQIINSQGKSVGEHRGIYFYTIGQRHLGIKNLGIKERGIDSKPLYVASKDVSTNTLVVAEGENHATLYQKNIHLFGLNDIAGRSDSTVVWARVRYRQPVTKARLKMNGTRGELIFEKAQKFVAPGQSAVFYTKDGTMLGGGIIQ